jgi:dTDP-4-dehydrorhamnose 3,5-epimerase
MKIIDTQIFNLFKLIPICKTDERGLFRRHFCKKILSEKGIDFDVKQGNISENRIKHTLRGFHYQDPKGNENKLISCISGAVYNVVIDLRQHSNTYLQKDIFILDDENRESLYVPAGCANAFLTLKNETIIHYYMNEYYGTESLGFKYNDPFFNIEWPFSPKIISKKDLEYLDFKS